MVEAQRTNGEVAKKAVVAVAGCGRMGGRQLLNLVRTGLVGEVRVADSGWYEERNREEQEGAVTGQAKTSRIAKIAREISGTVNIRPFPDIHALNAWAFTKDVDLVVDAIDFYSFDGRKELWDAVGSRAVPMLNAVGGYHTAACWLTKNPWAQTSPQDLLNFLLPHEAEIVFGAGVENPKGSLEAGIVAAGLGLRIAKRVLMGRRADLDKVERLVLP